mgnify:CR=1 FL=1
MKKERKFLLNEGLYYKEQDIFDKLPGNQIAYWIPDAIYDAFSLVKIKKCLALLVQA